MDYKRFQEWLSGIEQLSPAQRQQAEAVFPGASDRSASLAAVEASVGEDRQCPHCGTPGAVSRGKARGLRRYQCKGCKKTFNAATGTPLAGLHRKDRWLAFGTCLADGLTVRASAQRCGFAVNTAFLAAPISHCGTSEATQAHRPCRGRRNLCSEKPKRRTKPWAQGAPQGRQGQQTGPVG